MPTSRLLTGGFFEYELLDRRPGFLSAVFKGNSAKELFANEAGGHRFQRVSPTEKRGRVHTSTVTVATLDPEVRSNFKLNLHDVEIKTARGSGPGGQNRNKLETCVTATHKPSGVSVRIDMRSQHQSKEMALKILAAKVSESQNNTQQSSRDQIRRSQVGSGMRGDKVRTYREQDDKVTDNRTNQVWKFSQWMKGNW